MTTKKCKLCRQVLALSEFYQDKRGKYSSRCKKCHSLRVNRCIVCNKMFVGHANTKMCSSECRRKYRPQTFKICQQCGKRFGPVDRISRKFCSYKCKAESQKTGRHFKPCSKQARNAQRRVAYAIQKGTLVRPAECSNCGRREKVEAAHYNYTEPLRVRWLCKKCHHKWDKEQPKDKARILESKGLCQQIF